MVKQKDGLVLGEYGIEIKSKTKNNTPPHDNTLLTHSG
jgi:hypothetical protein